MPIPPILSGDTTSSSSTLRARLSSQPPPSQPGPNGPSSSSSISTSSRRLRNQHQGQRGDLYQHFRACFVPAPAGTPVSTYTRPASSGGDGLIRALGESIARDSFNLHSAVLEALSHAQSQILAEIATFSTHSSTALANLDTTYANIACPLSATLCHSANFPRATIAAHIASVQAKLKAAEDELAALRVEWDENVRQGERLVREIGAKPPRQDVVQMEAFRVEVERVAREQTRALDDIDAHYKELMQAKTMEMMQFMLAD